MRMLKRGLTGLLVLIFLGLNLPKAAYCEDSLLLAKAGKKNITWHEPKIMATPGKDIPMIQVENKNGKTKYIWYGLGAMVLLGVVAAGAGGGGGGGGGGDSSSDTGSIVVGW